MGNFFKNIFGSGIKNAASGVGGLAIDIRQALKGKELDPDKLIAYEGKILDLQLKQIELNKSETEHPSVWVSGARPFITWVCGTALLYNFILRDLLIFCNNEWAKLPALQMDELMTVLFGVLGLGGMRTYEKMKGVAKK